MLLAAALLTGHLTLPSQVGRYLAYTAVAVLAAVELGRGIGRHRPRHPRGWRLLQIGLWLHAGYGLTLLTQVLLPAVPGLVVAESVVDNLAHLFMAAAAVRFLAIRRPGRDRDGLLDAAVVLLAGALLFWQGWEQQARLAAALSVPVLSAAAVALLMAAAVVVGVRLYITDRPPLAFPVLVLGATVAFVGNLAVVLIRPAGAPPRWVETLWLLGVLLAALAAQLPGMQLLGEPEPARDRQVSPGRVAALGAALLVNPVLVVLWGTRATNAPRLLAAVLALLTLLVLWRIGRLVTEREQMRQQLSRAQDQLLHHATHDPLTDLPNRTLFLKRATQALADAGVSQPAVLFIDLDGFKAVNDTYGHGAGDELLVVVANRLQSCLRDADLVARMGGDEFALLLDTAQDPNYPVAVAKKVLRILADPVPLPAGTARIGASIGIATARSDASCVTALLSQADNAMYQAKRDGKNRYQLANPLIDLLPSPAPPFQLEQHLAVT